jgi:hypothetical protein
MTHRPLFVLLALFSLTALYACGQTKRLGTGIDPDAENGAASGFGGEEPGGGGTGGSQGGAQGGTASTAAGRGGGEPRAGHGGDAAFAGTGGTGVGVGGSLVTGGRQGRGGADGGSFSTSGNPGMEPAAGRNSCSLSTVDTTQGAAGRGAQSCTDVGTALKDAYEEELTGEVLEVAPLAGMWVDGSGADRIELELDPTGTGTLRFGEASDFPDISDPDEPFLTSIGENDASEVFGLDHSKPQLGFTYSVIADAGRGSEMSFHIVFSQAWDDWCAEQTPALSLHAQSCYACMEDAGYYRLSGSDCGSEAGCFASDGTGEETRVHCGRFALCLLPYSAVCACNEDECFANLQGEDQLSRRSYTVTLDPVDLTVLRLSHADPAYTHYLAKVE